LAEWHRYLVDNTTENTGTCVQVRAGIPYIAYYSNAGLKFAYWDSSGWVVDTLDSVTSIHNGNPSLVFDQQGYPHIAYFRGTPRYSYLTATGWQREEIDTDSSGDYISLCLDSASIPHVAYNSEWHDVLRSMLKYGFRDSTGWHVEPIDSFGGADCVLRFDNLGRPGIAHCAFWSESALYFSYRDDEGWVKDTILIDDATQCFLVLDDAGKPHISYHWEYSGDYDLRCADHVCDTWRIDVVDPGTDKCGLDNCIAYDHQGMFHISYHCPEKKYAHGNFGNWHVEIVDAVGTWNCSSSIALDDTGHAYIAYCDQDENGALYLASQEELTGINESGNRVLQAQEGCRLFSSGLELLCFLGDDRHQIRDISGRLKASNPEVLGSGVYFISISKGTHPRLFKIVLTR